MVLRQAPMAYFAVNLAVLVRITRKLKQKKSTAELEAEKARLGKEREGLESFKNLLFEKGTNLGTAIQKVFVKLMEASPDIITDVSEYEENIEDLLIKTSYGEAIVESKGVDRKSTSLRDLRQLDQYITDSEFDHGIPRKGILVGNPYRLDEPRNRDEAFPSNVKEFAEKREICLVTSYDLFKAFRQFLKDELSAGDIVRRMFDASGVCKF